jgi:Histidine phosphatase superfamily (branch 1)
MAMRRRPLLMASCWAAMAPPAAAEDSELGRTIALLRRGGVVVAFRHALAPGTFDPPGFRPGDCSTQRNLSDEGRDQARRIGAWFRQQRLQPAAVRASPWCRCVDTAQLAFGAESVQRWPALGSPAQDRSEAATAAYQERLNALRQALARGSASPQRFEVWVTHQFVLRDLSGESLESNQALVLRHEAERGVRIEARLNLIA